jgi:hypothetical protein
MGSSSLGGEMWKTIKNANKREESETQQKQKKETQTDFSRSPPRLLPDDKSEDNLHLLTRLFEEWECPSSKKP